MLRNAIKAVPVCFRSTPTDIVDNGMTAERTEPLAESSHTINVPQFQRHGKVLICRKVVSNDSGKMAQNLISMFAPKTNALKRVEIAVISIETQIGKAHKVLVVFAHLLTVQLFCFLVGEDKCRHFGSCCRAGRNIVLENFAPSTMYGLHHTSLKPLRIFTIISHSL